MGSECGGARDQRGAWAEAPAGTEVMANSSDALRAMLQSAGVDKHFDAFWRAGARPGCGHLWPLTLSSRTS